MNDTPEFTINVALPPIALELRKLRIKANKSLVDASLATGLKIQALTEIEYGTKKPTKRQIKLLCAFYGENNFKRLMVLSEQP